MFQTSLPLSPWTRPVTRTDVKVSISVMIACCSATASHCLKDCACKCGVWGKFNAKAFGIASWANDCQHVSALRFCLCPSTSTEDSEKLLFTSLQNTFHTSSHIYPPLSLYIYDWLEMVAMWKNRKWTSNRTRCNCWAEMVSKFTGHILYRQ